MCLHFLQKARFPSHPAEMSVLFLKLSFSAPLPSSLIFGKYAHLATQHVETLFPVVSFRVSWSSSEFPGHAYALLWSLTHVLIHFVKQNGEPLRVFLACYFILFFLHGKNMTLNFGYALLFLGQILAVAICQIQGTPNTDRWCFQNANLCIWKCPLFHKSTHGFLLPVLEWSSIGLYVFPLSRFPETSSVHWAGSVAVRWISWIAGIKYFAPFSDTPLLFIADR